MLDLGKLIGFEWDDANRNKNWIKHNVSADECEEVFFNFPLLLQSDKMHSIDENRYYVLGRTNAGRALFIVFTVRKEQIRVISARDMNKSERAIYEKAST